MIRYKISNIFSINALINKILVNGSVRMVLPQKQGLRLSSVTVVDVLRMSEWYFHKNKD